MSSNKDLFSWKDKYATSEMWKSNCGKKSTDFLNANAEGNFERSFHELCDNMDITINHKRFLYFFDFDFTFQTSISNITPDYEKILNQGLNSLRYYEKECTNEFSVRYNMVLSDMEILVERIVKKLQEEVSNFKDDEEDIYLKKQLNWFQRIRDEKAESFQEAIQRVLFLNQLLWHTGSKLVGLGRLDKLLYSFYKKDVSDGIITKEEVKQSVKDFIHILHDYYWYKSSVLLGDTGQVITIGGLNTKGEYEINDLSYIFLDVVKECQLSDPKIVLRTSSSMPREVMEEAVCCMKTGIGSPLLSNDDIIIPKLIDFGIEAEDAYDYMTSACWEPLIGGKSSSMNNQQSLKFINALNVFLMEENLNKIESFEVFKERFWKYLKREIIKCERGIYNQIFFRNTLYSVFMEGCKDNKKDIVDGGAKYHNVGMTSVGLGNLVNALLNIDRYVFKEKKYNLIDVKKMACFNYEGYPDAEAILKNSDRRYGQDKEEIIALANEITQFVTEYTKNFRTPIGGKLKFGVSSPSYIMDANEVQASFDGRKKGEPFIVHISNEKLDSYTELINFAAKLDYHENRFNGNVVDFMVNPSFLEHNFDKFVTLLMCGAQVGYFQLQINVVSSDMLIEARNNPDKYPNLIVRVWGFSAYFVELPESYQDLLIERALNNEGKSA